MPRVVVIGENKLVDEGNAPTEALFCIASDKYAGVEPGADEVTAPVSLWP